MAKKIHIKPGKGQSKFGFVAGIIFCMIGLFIVIPVFGLFGVLWTALTGFITYVNYRNGFTDKQIDSHVIEIEENGEDVIITQHAGFGGHSYSVEDSVSSTKEAEKESVEERLKKLTNLYAQSLITREEYEQKKKEILDEL